MRSMTKPDPVRRFDGNAAKYAASELHRSSPSLARLNEIVQLPARASVCDVACGTGNLGLSFANRAAHEAAVLRILDAAQPDYIVLAGYMRLLSADFVERYRNRILNIHPSLLPAFPGVDAQAQALAHGVKIAGCTVHFVDEHLDAGPILVQRAVPVLEGDTVETLSARILMQEHEAYVEALKKLSSRA
jgi:phosphoribosylglycinamide formyltransferase-1